MHAFDFLLSMGAWGIELRAVGTGFLIGSPEQLAASLRATPIFRDRASHSGCHVDMSCFQGGELRYLARGVPLDDLDVDQWAKECWEAAVANDHACLGFECVPCAEDKDAAIARNIAKFHAENPWARPSRQPS